MMCNICGIEYDTPSMGGPGICPRCGCVNAETDGIKRQQERIAALEAENARLKTALLEAGHHIYGGLWIDHSADCEAEIEGKSCTCGLKDWMLRNQTDLGLNFAPETKGEGQ